MILPRSAIGVSGKPAHHEQAALGEVVLGRLVE
jgi:hypothetical protein